MGNSFRDADVDVVSTFYAFDTGENKFRIVSPAIPFWTAFDRDEGTAQQFVTMAAADAWNKSVSDEKQAKRRFGMWVIDRKDGKIRFAKFGPAIMRQIRDLANSTEYGFLETVPPYDHICVKTGAAMETRYAVTAARANTDITASELAEIQKLEKPYDFLLKEAVDRDTAPPEFLSPSVL